jgi:hypothetical protein
MTQGNQRRPGLKVVVEELEGRTVVGVQAKDCDPLITALPGLTLEEAMVHVPELVASAIRRWNQNARMPTYQRPPELPKPATPAATATAPARPRQPETSRPRLI